MKPGVVRHDVQRDRRVARLIVPRPGDPAVEQVGLVFGPNADAFAHQDRLLNLRIVRLDRQRHAPGIRV